MTLGFIIIRHVNSETTDLYWKECYSCIRKFYENPIMIIDDSSNKEFLKENIELINCSVVYDLKHKGCGEILPYYYFYKLKPFDTAVIIHDSVFIQSPINFELDDKEDVRILWSFYHYWDNDLLPLINDIWSHFNHKEELTSLFHKKYDWLGSFGTMSVIRWDFLNLLQEKHNIFDDILVKIKSRDHRSALERIFGLLFCYHYNNCKDMFGNIFTYIKEGTTFHEYKSNIWKHLPIVKVWTGR